MSSTEDKYAAAISSFDTLQALIEARHAKLAKAIMSGDVETFLSFYSSDIDFKDWSKRWFNTSDGHTDWIAST